jgi:hypothetical protein
MKTIHQTIVVNNIRAFAASVSSPAFPKAVQDKTGYFKNGTAPRKSPKKIMNTPHKTRMAEYAFGFSFLIPKKETEEMIIYHSRSPVSCPR